MYLRLPYEPACDGLMVFNNEQGGAAARFHKYLDDLRSLRRGRSFFANIVKNPREHCFAFGGFKKGELGD